MYVCGSVTKHVGRRPNTHHRLHLMVHIWHMHLCCMVGPLHPQSWRRGPVKRCQPIMPSPVSVRTYATRHCIAAADLAWLARSGKYCRYCSRDACIDMTHQNNLTTGALTTSDDVVVRAGVHPHMHLSFLLMHLWCGVVWTGATELS